MKENKMRAVQLLFNNTQEAVKYGHGATIEEMQALFRKLLKIFSQSLVDLSYNVQVLGEAIHAHDEDRWYEHNKD
jgi:hypothetical protein